MIFSVTYDLELHKAITVYCTSHFFTSKGRMGCLDIIEHGHLLLGENLQQKLKKI